MHSPNFLKKMVIGWLALIVVLVVLLVVALDYSCNTGLDEGDFVEVELTGQRGIVSWKMCTRNYVKLINKDGTVAPSSEFNAKELRKLTDREATELKQKVREASDASE